MAQATNYFPSQNVSVWYEKETKVGRSQDDTVDNAGLTKLQTTSFSIPVETDIVSPLSIKDRSTIWK